MAARKTVKSPKASKTSKAAKTAKLAALPIPQLPVIKVPALGPGLMAEPGFAALKIPVKLGGSVATAGVVFLRGALHVEPGHGPVDSPCTLFTLPAGMAPSTSGKLIATFRDQGPAPVVPIELSLSSSGAVGLFQGPSLGSDATVWLDGISFML
jgi:hypothetical protein